MENANKMLVNGKSYTVARMGEKIIELLGPRGGAALLVKNIHTGRWVLIVDANNGRGRPRTVAVESMEVL